MERIFTFGGQNLRVMERKNGDKPNQEPLLEGAPWRLLDGKIPLLERYQDFIKNPDDQTTYKRAAYNPETQALWFLADPEITQLRKFIDTSSGPDHIRQAVEDARMRGKNG